MAAQPRFSGLDTAAPPQPSATTGDAANHPAEQAAPQPPWQVRHARELIAATVLLVIGLAYGAYRAWQFDLDPADRIAAAVRPAPAVVPAAPPIVELRVPAVTHTRREPPPLTAVAARPPACGEAIVALGLCTPEREVRK